VSGVQSIVYPGRVLYVPPRWDRFTIDVRLGFGVHREMPFRVEGVDYSKVPPDDRAAMRHCLVIAWGGKRVLVHTSPYPRDGEPAWCRLYLDERATAPPPAVMVVPWGRSTPMVEGGEFFEWVCANGFRHDAVRAMLNGRADGAPAAQ